VPFGEGLKLKIRRRAAFRCCRCHEIGVEVHHILPQADGGPDTEDNAAPLCPNCHTWFGANPEKRKEIRQMRDWWYDVCDSKYGSDVSHTDERLDELLAEMRRNRSNEDARGRVIEEMSKTLRELIETSMPDKRDSDEEVVAKVNEIVTATRLGPGTYANVHCTQCNSFIGLLIGSDKCPNCGAAI
jgi:hypothetical protein